MTWRRRRGRRPRPIALLDDLGLSLEERRRVRGDRFTEGSAATVATAGCAFAAVRRRRHVLRAREPRGVPG